MCGTLNEADKAACEEGTAVPNNDSVHDINCKVCGGFIRKESHTYTYTSAGTLSHIGICNSCGSQIEGECEFDQNGDCTMNCGNHHIHKWDSSTGMCKDCGVTCKHDYDTSTHKCTICDKECKHEYGYDVYTYDGPEHELECHACKYKWFEAHKFETQRWCNKCNARVSACSVCNRDEKYHQ